MPDKADPPGRPAPARRKRGGAPAAEQGPPARFMAVGIGASAGGLNAARALLSGFEDGPAMAFILIQHLMPGQDSMMSALLADHTKLIVTEAVDHDVLEPGHLYLIPPGTQLAVEDGKLRISHQQNQPGHRYPVDHLLRTLAAGFGRWAACVILSGTGLDGSEGAQTIKRAGGLVIAQSPDEAEFEGMPAGVVATGCVDAVLPAAGIHAALVEHAKRLATQREPGPGRPDPLGAIVGLLREQTAHDFTFYKPGTLRRRIERRMAMSPLAGGNMEQYLAALREDPAEVERLAKDLLINVTGFFRDGHVFKTLAASVVPDLLKRKAPDQPIRIWVAGCSTGEETYSLAMVFREAVEAMRRNVKLQIFASDVDGNAIAKARLGVYPASVVNSVSPERLARFFQREEDGSYRIAPELRLSVVFAVQDLLADPPFSRIDLVSCRNLLIYLKPEAQAKVIHLFDFALAESGVLLLGSAETIGDMDGRFEVISKAARLYRHVGRSAPGSLRVTMGTANSSMRLSPRTGQTQGASRQAALATLTQRLVLEAHAPAAVLINLKHDCLYSLGPTEKYLRVPPGPPSHDLLAMARPSLRTKLRAGIYRAGQETATVVIPGGQVSHDGQATQFSIVIRPITDGGEPLLLVTFVDEGGPPPVPAKALAADDSSRVQVLELELEAARTELQGAIRSLEMSNEEQKAVNEEALSVNEEYQSTNEELLTSKEELQSLNEELTALNSQLQETLERQRTMSNDLQNVFYSTDVATLFLDRDLRIRFFTPATQSLFNVIPSDLGRPLTDIRSLGADDGLADDVQAVLERHSPVEREVQQQGGQWFSRRVLPYRKVDNSVEGAVITFTDITQRRRAAQVLEDAQREAQVQARDKGRLMEDAGHEMRRSLQALVLLQELLAREPGGETARALLARAGLVLSAVTGLLDTSVVVGQSDRSTVQADAVSVIAEHILAPLRDGLAAYADANGSPLKILPCSLAVRTNPRLLDLLLRTLLVNILRHNADGRVLVGCRRRPDRLRIEVWATGIDLPAGALEAMLQERDAPDVPPVGRSLAQSLAFSGQVGALLGHPVQVVTKLGQISVFSIEVPLAAEQPPPRRAAAGAENGARAGSVLVVAQDPETRDLLRRLLTADGHRVVAARDGSAAMAVAGLRTPPDAVVIDLDDLEPGIRVSRAMALREQVRQTIPIILLTDDGAAAALRPVAADNLVGLVKPARWTEIRRALQRPSPAARPRRPRG